jgi:uncharacterized repeat protein (TIGR01451 family)
MRTRARRFHPLIASLLFAAALLLGAAPAQAQSCAAATGQGSAPAGWETYCWLNLSGYNDSAARTASGQAMSFTLTDGSVLSFRLRVTPTSGSAFDAVAAPSWSGAAVGNSAFLGIPGRPVLYSTAAGTRTINISNIAVTPPAGAAASAYSFVVADAESSNENESLVFTTNGGAWQLLDQVPAASGSSYPARSGTGTSTFTITGAAGTVGAYIVGSNSPTTVSAQVTSGGLQGVMFAVRFASVRLSKQIVGARVDASDQFLFRVRTTGSTTDLAQGTTSGTGTGPFAAAPVSLASSLSITLSEEMGAGSASSLARYRSTLTCTNGNSGSSTVLPSGVQATSYALPSLQFGDVISCTFTNIAYPHLRLRKALGSGGRRYSGDQFSVRILDGSTVLAAATTSGTGSTVNGGDTGLIQVVPGTAYGLDELAAGTTDLVRYDAALACTNGWTASSTDLPGTPPGTITLQMGDVVSCTITNVRTTGGELIIEKSSSPVSDPVNGAINPKLIPGAIVEYAITVTSIGTGSNGTRANNILLADPLPPGVEFQTGSVTFTNGSPASGLGFSNANVSYSNRPNGGAPYNYTPTGSYDPAVTGIRIAPSGNMSHASSATNRPSFTIRFRARVE